MSFSGNEESERETNARLLGVTKYQAFLSLITFFFVLELEGISPLSHLQLQKRKRGYVLQMVRLSDQDLMCLFHPKCLVAQLGVISTGS